MKSEPVDLRQGRMTRRLEAVKELGDCIRDIRRLPEHQRFLLGPTREGLKDQASEGPLVVVNVTDVRGDTIIVTSSTVKSVRLPELTAAKAMEWGQENLTIYHQQNTPVDWGKRNQRYLKFLLWLWSKCVKVILKEIYDGEKPTLKNLLRVW